MDINSTDVLIMKFFIKISYQVFSKSSNLFEKKNETLSSKSVSTTNFVIWSLISCYPRLAQLVEHQTSNHEVMSSSLTWGSFLFYARLYTVIVHCAFTFLDVVWLFLKTPLLITSEVFLNYFFLEYSNSFKFELF